MSTAVLSSYNVSSVGTIPTVVTSDHHYVLMHWGGLNDADLLHIDGHADMSDGPSIKSANGRYLNIANFICAAIHDGVISRVYWLNPHSSMRPLQYLGSADNELTTWTNMDNGIYWFRRDIESGDGEPVARLSLRPEKPFIVDIDLDAFCCNKRVHFTYSDYEGISNYERRIDNSMRLLSNSKRPDLITVIRSHGNHEKYVPSDKVDDVQEYLFAGLREVYEV